MVKLEQIAQHFPEFSSRELDGLAQYMASLRTWNERINLVSRKDVNELETHHLLHSLTIAKLLRFAPGTRILDVGTGGGLPGIPLAIVNPDANFVLIDRIGKKVEAVKAMALKLGLRNVETLQVHARDIEGPFDFVVSRAVTRLPEFKLWIGKKISVVGKNSIPNGILYLKGGEVEFELKEVGWPATVYDLSKSFQDPWFATKKLLHIRPPGAVANS